MKARMAGPTIDRRQRSTGGGQQMTTDFVNGVDRDRLAAVCRRYGIASLSMFGSAARGAAEPCSDLDLLYELVPGTRLGWEIDDLADELSEIFGRPVDLVSRVGLHPLLAPTVLDEARPLYAA
jgi:predicted nucleotidyltransferase